MKTIIVKKGYDINILGEPAPDIVPIEKPEAVAVLPERIPFIKPRLKVAVGDRVQIGSDLFEDKRNPDLRFLSPGGGVISEINFGPRRVIKEIVIRLNADEAARTFDTVSEEELEQMARQDLVQRIVEGGLWALIRKLPFRNTADTRTSPPMLLVGLDSKEPFHPLPEVYLKDNPELFSFGMKIFEKLAEGRLILFCSSDRKSGLNGFSEHLTHVVSGKYPASDPGALLYKIKKNPREAGAWYVSGQDLLLIAQLIRDGRYPVERVVAVGGSGAAKPCHVKTRIGAPLKLICPDITDGDNKRLVLGGLFRGYASEGNGYMGLLETALTVLPEGDTEEFLALFRPGFKKPTFSRAYLSRLTSHKMVYDCNRHGGRRACIACMHCVDVCPVDILPEFTYKAILAEEVEESLAHGLLDCLECGLCSYVCPSKIELSETFTMAKSAYAKDQVQDE